MWCWDLITPVIIFIIIHSRGKKSLDRDLPEKLWCILPQCRSAYNHPLQCKGNVLCSTNQCKISEHPAVHCLHQCSEVGDTLYMFDGVVKPASIGQLHSDHVLNRSQPLHCNLQKTAQYFVLWMHYAYILEPELHQNALNQSLFSIRIEMQCNWIKMRLQCALHCIKSVMETTFATGTCHMALIAAFRPS